MNTPAKKVKLSIVLSLLIVTFSYGQRWDYWSDPISITDSLTDSRNAVYQSFVYPIARNYIFWENSIDSLTTQVLYKKIDESGDPMVLLSDSGVHYGNVSFLDYAGGYPTNFLLYESDETGINKVYYQYYYPDGFTEPQLLTNSDQEQRSVLCNEDGRIVWVEQNQVMHMKLSLDSLTFDDPVIIDTGNCLCPSLTQFEHYFFSYVEHEVAWIKNTDNESHILMRSWDVDLGWLPIDTIFSGLECKNLAFCTGTDWDKILTWDYFNGNRWYAKRYILTSSELSTSEFSEANPLEYSYFTGYEYSKLSPWSGFSTMVYNGESGSSDIFTTKTYCYTTWYLLNSYENVSESVNYVSNPQVWYGKSTGGGYNDFYNIWEEKVNDHWQLKYSTTSVYLASAEDGNAVKNSNLSVRPNPMNSETTIRFSIDSSSDVMLSIYNISGVEIEILENKKLNKGEYTYTWNRKSLNPGMYFTLLNVNNEYSIEKIVVSE